MIIWTISLETDCQHNTYCVDDKNKIEPYIDNCMKAIKKYDKYTDNKYVIKWLMVDYAVIYVADERCNPVFPTRKFGEINRHKVH
jgi:hypothetical protein